MTGFEFSETHQAVEEFLRRYCTEEIEPLVPQLEEGSLSSSEVLRKLSATFQMKEMFAEPMLMARNKKRNEDEANKSGGSGSGSDPAIPAILFKELSRVSPGLSLCLLSTFGCGATIASKAPLELAERLALPLLSLETVGCWALTEPATGSDAFAMRTTATLDGDTVTLNGSKAFISNAPCADVFLIYARLVEQASDRDDKTRIFPVVVEKGTPGLTLGKPIRKMGMHACPTGEIFFDDVAVPRSHLLGDPAKPARDVAEATLSTERAAIVAMCLGVIERCLQDATRYAIDREQFGKPIAAFQLTQQKLARMFVAKENVQNLLLKLIWLQTEKRGTPAEISGAKWYATEAAVSVAMDAVQLMGGMGYSSESAPERLMRDIKLWTIGGGTSEIQQLTIAKHLLRQEGFSIDLAGGYSNDASQT